MANLKNKLEYYILQILKRKYSNAYEIENELLNNKIEYNRKDFFPVLSHLFLSNYLCYNWINKKGTRVKYYHITPIGAELINKDKLSLLRIH